MNSCCRFRQLSCKKNFVGYFFESSSKLCSNFPKDDKQNASPLKRSVEDVKKLLDDAAPLKSNLKDDDTFATTPYPEGTVFSRFSPTPDTLRPDRDPATTSVILFPGQGTQYVGMGADLMKYPVAKEMFKCASSILGYDLLKLCREGPPEKLMQTKYCQPAIVVCSLATVEKLKDENPDAINNCVGVAGFSVGEISALVFAGCINFEKAIKLVRTRAQAMQLCSEMTPGGMMTLLLAPDSLLNQALKDAVAHCTELGIEDPVCAVANYLYPSAKVIAGNNEALDFIAANSAKYNIRRTTRLPVSGAFHTNLMKPAVEVVEAVLKKGIVNDSIIPIYRNIDGKPYNSGASVANLFPQQLCRPVKWEQTLHFVYSRRPEVAFPQTYECGPGKSLITLLRKVNAKASEFSYNIQC